jgi:hypothetical protein
MEEQKIFTVGPLTGREIFILFAVAFFAATFLLGFGGAATVGAIGAVMWICVLTSASTETMRFPRLLRSPLSLKTVPPFRRAIALVPALLTAMFLYGAGFDLFLFQPIYSPSSLDRIRMGLENATRAALAAETLLRVLLLWGLPAFICAYVVLRWFRGMFVAAVLGGAACGVFCLLLFGVIYLEPSRFLRLVFNAHTFSGYLMTAIISGGGSGAVAWCYMWLLRRRDQETSFEGASFTLRGIQFSAVASGATLPIVLVFTPYLLDRAEGFSWPTDKERETDNVAVTVGDIVINMPLHGADRVRRQREIVIVMPERDSRFRYSRPLTEVQLWINGPKHRGSFIYPAPGPSSMQTIRLDGETFLGATPNLLCSTQTMTLRNGAYLGRRCSLESPLTDMTSVKVSFSDGRFPPAEWPELLASLESGIREITSR